jgi:hypothetical protein
VGSCFPFANGQIQPEAETVHVVQNVIHLFNGTNLHGLHPWLVDTTTNDPRRVFTVTNGMIRISGNGLGYLASERAYRDYHLVTEFKWGRTNWAWGDRVGKARDAGIFLHATGPDGNSHDGDGAFKAAIECNIFQGATGDFLLIRGSDASGALIAPRLTAEVAPRADADGWFTWQKGGRRQRIERWGRLNWFGKSADWRDVTDFRGPRDVTGAPGEWTKVECICRGDEIVLRVNGVTVNHATGVWPSQGQILLQCEGSEIFFRKLELHPLAE